MNIPESYLPKLLSLGRYTRKDVLADLLAGVTVGLVALPLAMAFAIASGATPQAGLYTAIAGGAIVAIFGGSRFQIAGPTGAFVVIVAGIVAKHGVPGLLVVTAMAGAILVFLGLTGLGNAIKFIPRPIVIGFTNGIALLIASTQIKDFFGLKFAGNPSEFFARTHAIVSHLSGIDPATAVIGVSSLAIFLLVSRFAPRVPAAIVTVAAAAIATAAFHLPIDTIASRFGGIPSGLPRLALPPIHPDLFLQLLPSAITVAVLGSLESLLSAVVADSLTGDRHHSNAELIAQGAANLFVPLVGGIPVTGAIARTGTNIRSGAKSPISGLVHSLTLLAIVLVCAPLASAVPLASLAAVLLVVAYRIGEWHEIGAILRLDKTDRSVWFVTFALTVCADLTIAVGVGLGLAALLYIYRVTQTTTVSTVSNEEIEENRVHVLQDKSIPPYVAILRIHGPFLFGTTDKLFEESLGLTRLATVVILRLRNMTAIDATGLHAIETLHERLRASGKTLLVCGARSQPARLLNHTAFLARLGAENVLPNVDAALSRAKDIHESFDGLGDELAATPLLA
ncbi:MAG TPA: SulP family inorganic anion transporter [Candidatus Baltobacteraceae bacterium]|jgi:SulP family sulfate permease